MTATPTTEPTGPTEPTGLAPEAVTEAHRAPWWRGGAVIGGIFLVGCLTPFLIADLFTMQLTLDAAILATLALSLGFLARYLGVISLGHTAFFGGAAYFTAIATTHWGWGPSQAALFAVLTGSLLALAMGLLVVRATGMGFLMLTLALGQAMYQITIQTSVRPITGAYDGIQTSYDSERTFFGLPSQYVMDPTVFWFVAWGVLMALVVAVWAIGRSPFGTVLQGIRDNEERMRFSGFNTFVPRLIAFTFSGFMASVGGVLFVVHANYVSPEVLSFLMIGDSLIAAIIGGLGTLAGPIVGAGLYVFAQAYFNVGGNLHLYTGIALIGVLLFLPGGITGGVRDLWNRFAPFGRKDQR